jgi:hypothetical protein
MLIPPMNITAATDGIEKLRVGALFENSTVHHTADWSVFAARLQSVPTGVRAWSRIHQSTILGFSPC